MSRYGLYQSFSVEELQQIMLPVDYQEALKSKTLEIEKPYRFNGLVFCLEYQEGDIRTGKNSNGQSWENTMPAGYGYVPGVDGVDGEGFDVYVANTLFDPTSAMVYVIVQLTPTGMFDEHKAMVGFGSRTEALDTYHKAFSDQSTVKRLGGCWSMTYPTFLDWLKTDKLTPVAPVLDIPDFTSTTKGLPLEHSRENLSTEMPISDVETPAPTLPQPFLLKSIQGPTLDTSVVDNKTCYVFSLFGPMILDGESTATGINTTYNQLLFVLFTASVDDTVTLLIASGGGEVSLGARIASAIRSTKANVITVAVGGVASAACLVWCEGKTRYVTQGAFLMQHMSSHGASGNSMRIREDAAAFIDYLNNVVYPKAQAIGLLTDDDLKEIKTIQNHDIFLDAVTVSTRTGATMLDEV